MQIIKDKDLFKSTSTGSSILISMIIFYGISSFLMNTLKFPRTILYLGDILNIISFIYALNPLKFNGKIKVNGIYLWMWIFIIISMISSIGNMVSPVLFLWGVRNNFRYFIFFYSCTKLLKKKDIYILLRLIKIAFWISVPLCTYQALFMSYGPGTIVGDMVGGIFYGFAGVNSPLNVLLILHVSVTMINYFSNKTSIKNLIIVITAGMYISALAELKVFIIEFVIISLILMIWRGLNIKTITISIISIIGLSSLITMLVYFNGTGKSNYEDLLSVSGLISYATKTEGYDGVGDLNRMTAIPVLYNDFLSRDIFKSLFGIGLGNADYSAGFSFLQSEFYKNYNYTHYHYFTAPWILLETGVLGLVSFFMIFINSYFISNTANKNEKAYIQLSKTIALFMIFLSFYNTSLRGEHSSYLLYMVLSIPFAIRNTEFEIERNKYD